ncbi:hypothetical protein FB639_005469 [Coemansia asiatica]|nr:hypothetical protein FB639_005469 [Coemansia asiatica]
MVVEIQRDHMLFDLKDTLLQTSMFRDIMWPNIRRLCVITDLNSVSLSDDSADSDDDDISDSTNAVLKQAADTLVNILVPNVIEVQFSTKGCGLRHMCFCGHLVSGYAEKLTKVIDSTWVFFTLAQSLEFLTVLDLDLSISFEPLFPRINPKQLRILRLNNTPPFFSWRVFDKPDNQDHEPIVFSNLITLDFHMNQYSVFEDLSDFEEEYEFCGQVIFPKLEILGMKCWPRLGAHFGSCVFPQKMHKITCYGSVKAFAEITDLQPILITECLDMTATFNEYISYDLFSTMKRYAVHGTAPRRVELTLENAFDEVKTHILTWTALTRLQLQSAEFDQLLLLLNHLERLDYLAVSDTYFDYHWQESCNNSQAFEQVSNSQLTVLCIEKMVDNANNAVAMECIERLMQTLKHAVVFKTLDNISRKPLLFHISDEQPYMQLKG